MGRNHHDGVSQMAGDRAEDQVPLRQSTDDPYASDAPSDDDLDLGELDPLHDKSRRSASRSTGTRAGQRVSRAYETDDASAVTLTKVTQKAARWSTCIIITFILLGGLLVVTFAGGVYVYKTSPPAGESPPWYPTRE